MPETKKIFDEVASHYDWLNTLFSLGIHRLWRKKLADELLGAEYNLDIATGTAEVEKTPFDQDGWNRSQHEHASDSEKED